MPRSDSSRLVNQNQHQPWRKAGCSMARSGARGDHPAGAATPRAQRRGFHFHATCFNFNVYGSGTQHEEGDSKGRAVAGAHQTAHGGQLVGQPPPHAGLVDGCGSGEALQETEASDRGTFDFPGGDCSFSPSRIVAGGSMSAPSSPASSGGAGCSSPSGHAGGKGASASQSHSMSSAGSRGDVGFFQTMEHRACECASVICTVHIPQPHMCHLLACYCDSYQYHPGMGGFPDRELTTFQT